MKSRFINYWKTTGNNVLEYCSNLLKTCFISSFSFLRTLIGILNVIFFIIGSAMLIVSVTMYIVPSYHVFIDSMKYIFAVHTIFGVFMAIGFVSALLGVFGIYFLVKEEYDRLGLQASVFLVLLIVLAAVSFSFYTEWNENAHFGISYATQSYDPEKKDHLYFSSIQHFLRCCGALGPDDYNIGNEYFATNQVPISCCDNVRHGNYCIENLSTLHKEFQHGSVVSTGKTSKSKKALKISMDKEKAYQIGCQTKMENIVMPIIMISVIIHSTLCLIALIVTGLTCSGYHSIMKPDDDDGVTKGNGDNDDGRGEIKTIGDCRDNTTMELLSHLTNEDTVSGSVRM